MLFPIATAIRQYRLDVRSRNDLITQLVFGAERQQAQAMLVEYPGYVNARIRWGITPLVNAALFNDHEAADLLLRHGADPNVNVRVEAGYAVGGQTRLSPLAIAIHNENRQMAELLLASGATVGTLEREALSRRGDRDVAVFLQRVNSEPSGHDRGDVVP